MQTFLPYKDFTKSAQCLDYRRLGKQRVETKQLLQKLLNETTGKGWINHPACKMWKNHEEALAEYGYKICLEWISRGYKDSLLNYFKDRLGTKALYPKWLGSTKFHNSHKSNLLRKDYNYYKKYNWNVPDNLPYIWPLP